MSRDGAPAAIAGVDSTGVGSALRTAGMTILVALALAGCGHRSSGGPAGANQAADLRARSQALIENGNQAFRTGDYALAARRYASATVIDPDDPAAYYGLGMALTKLGRDEQARSMYTKARELTRQGFARSDSGAAGP